jgi:hypothetical protein
MFTSPTFTGNTVLGTPISGTLTNCTGLPYGGISAVAWSTSWTPVAYSHLGLITASRTGYYVQIGKIIILRLKIVITAITGTDYVYFDLPTPSKDLDNVGCGAEAQANGKSLVITQTSTLGTSCAIIYYYDRSCPAANTTLICFLTYEAA